MNEHNIVVGCVVQVQSPYKPISPEEWLDKVVFRVRPHGFYVQHGAEEWYFLFEEKDRRWRRPAAAAPPTDQLAEIRTRCAHAEKRVAELAAENMSLLKRALGLAGSEAARTVERDELQKEKDALETQLREVRAHNAELERLFELQQTRVKEATKLWQEAHSPDVLPDLGKLVEWLLEQRIKK